MNLSTALPRTRSGKKKTQTKRGEGVELNSGRIFVCGVVISLLSDIHFARRDRGNQPPEKQQGDGIFDASWCRRGVPRMDVSTSITRLASTSSYQEKGTKFGTKDEQNIRFEGKNNLTRMDLRIPEFLHP